MSCATERPRPLTGDPRGEVRERENPAPRVPSSRGSIEPGERHPPEAHAEERPEETITLSKALSELAAILPRVADALERQADERPRVEPLTYRLEDLVDALGLSRRFLERERAAGRLPKPDLRLGKVPLWRVETIRSWLGRGGRL